MNWQQQLMVNNGICALLAPQRFFKRVSRSGVFLPGCQWKVLAFHSVSVHCESPHIQEQLLGKTWCPRLLNLYQFSALWGAFTQYSPECPSKCFPYWQKECSAFQWEIDFCVCVFCLFFSFLFFRILTGFRQKSTCLSRLLTIPSWWDFTPASRRRAGLSVLVLLDHQDSKDEILYCFMNFSFHVLSSNFFSQSIDGFITV